MSVPSVSAARGLQAATPTATPRADNPPAQTTTYVVKSGDNLWSIATKIYGNGALYTLIQRANNLPDKPVLSVGSILVIPPLNEASGVFLSPTVSPATATPVATATPDNSKSAPNGLATPTPTATAISTPNPPPPPPGGDILLAFLAPFVQMSAYMISGFCFVGSLLCAYMSLESYRHSRPYVRRRRIGNRIRVGL